LKENLKRKIAWFVTTLQEAFSAIIPYFLLLSFLTLFFAIVNYYDISFYFINKNSLKPFLDMLKWFSSIIIIISIAYFFAKRFQVSSIISVTLAIAAYVTVVVIENPDHFFGNSYGFSIQTLFVPIVTTIFLKFFYPKLNLSIPLEDENVHIYRLFNYIFVFAVAYFATVATYVAADNAAEYAINKFESIEFNMSNIVALFLRDIAKQIFWFFGIHGDHAINALTGKELLGKEIFPNLNVAEFNRLFVVIGGAGAGIPMLIALMIYSKDRLLRIITRLSIPLVIFNINTLLIYAVVVFNRFLLVPFVAIPLFNILFAYGALLFIHVEFLPHKLVWITPIFIDNYIKTGGNISVYIIQIFLLFADTLIYMYYVKRFMDSQSIESHISMLENNLDIPYSIRASQNIESFIAQREIIESNARLNNIIKDIKTENLTVYFQPKIDLKANKCDHFEALIRYNKKGKVTGPDFLELIEKARMAPVIDVWVAKEVNKSIELWEQEGFSPTININLHPDTLSNKQALRNISKILQGRKVNFEIIERSFTEGEEAIRGLKSLQDKGFGISIDDYGVGYSNMETILNYKISELKIDKGLIDRIEERNGAIICENIINLCDNLGMKIVAEGVETIQQVKILKKMQVGYVQGYYFAHALPFDEVIEYAGKFDINKYLHSVSNGN